MPDFLPGLELSRRYYREVVGPILGSTPHAAARVGWGSDVLGYDTERSTDHGWGPRIQIFVAKQTRSAVEAKITAELPVEFLGWPTHFGWDAVAPRHWVEVFTIAGWQRTHFGFVLPKPMTTEAWLAQPSQLLRTATDGIVVHDPDGTLAEMRDRLRWYPDDVWRYVLASQWQRISQEHAFVGRANECDDALGARIIAARLLRDLMRLAFLIERVHAPYSKWFGTAFNCLSISSELRPRLETALTAASPHDCGSAMADAYEILGLATSRLNLCMAFDPSRRPFHARPFVVSNADVIVGALRAAITDSELRQRPLIGAIDQWTDNTEITQYGAWSLRRLGGRESL